MLHMCLSTRVFCMFDKNKDNRKRVTTGKEEKKKKTCLNNSTLFITPGIPGNLEGTA
jgi:hypothetical protein